MVTQSSVEQLIFEPATFSSPPLFKASYFFKTVSFSQDPHFYKILFQIIYFFIANLISTDTFSIYQLVSNPINIRVFRYKNIGGLQIEHCQKMLLLSSMTYCLCISSYKPSLIQNTLWSKKKTSPKMN